MMDDSLLLCFASTCFLFHPNIINNAADDDADDDSDGD